jgi:hypothetical protein
MPSPADDRYYGGEGGSAKAFRQMVKTYCKPGESTCPKAVQVYEATKNRNRKQGKGDGLRTALRRRSKR